MQVVPVDGAWRATGYSCNRTGSNWTPITRSQSRTVVAGDAIRCTPRRTSFMSARLHSLCFRWFRSITHGVAVTAPRPATSTVGIVSRPGVACDLICSVPWRPERAASFRSHWGFFAKVHL
jgi:hypothetical protein